MDISAGYPQKSCLQSVHDDLGGQIGYLGIALLVNAFLMILLVSCSYPICSYSKKLEDEEIEHECRQKEE
jgi:hypothetical protein